MKKVPSKFAFKCLILFILRIVDIPAKITIADRTQILYSLQSVGINTFNPKIFNFLCACADLAITLNIRSIKYFSYSSLFPNSISSIENAILHFKMVEFYPIICFYEPMYLVRLPSTLPMLALLISGMHNNHPLCSVWIRAITEIYDRGYETSHLPSLNGFWYLSMSMVEQYSKLCYTLLLVYGNYLIGRDWRLHPVFKNSSTFTSYLPSILGSKVLDIFCITAMVFEYLYTHFKTSVGNTNTNFIFWTSLVFVGLYIVHLKPIMTLP